MGCSFLYGLGLTLLCLGHFIVLTCCDGNPSAVDVVEKAVVDAKINNQPTQNPVDNNLSDTNNATNSTVQCVNDMKNSSNCISNERSNHGSFMKRIIDNKAMLIRTMYVLVALTSIVVVYFVVRWVRLRHKRNKSRKYGLITAPSDLEMAPLDQEDDEDDDMTVFELNGPKK